MLKYKKLKMLFVILILFLPNVITFGVINKNVNSLSFTNLSIRTEHHETQVESPDLADPFFTLNALACKDHADNWTRFFPILKSNLEELNINLSITEVTWPQFLQQIALYKDYDLAYMEYGGNYNSPDDIAEFLYSENSTYNSANYNTSYDWLEAIGTGINEWYIDQGLLIYPPYSQERIDHYKEWQEYLMENIHPVLPAFTEKSYSAYWSTLTGLNVTDGIIQSWGKMDWSSLHAGQNYTDEFVFGMYNYSSATQLNPIYNTHVGSISAARFVNYATMDPLIWFDSDKMPYPHLATSWSDINDTHIRLSVRDDVKWQTDPDGMFSNEYMDVKDVYFTLYCLKDYYVTKSDYSWLEDIKIVDQNTIDIFIDYEPGTPENEPFMDYIEFLEVPILPEHYLNQTQEIDGITPDYTHSSWAKFNRSCFGTGMLEIDSIISDKEIKLTKFTDSWKYDAELLIDPDLKWDERFGTTWALDTMIIRMIKEGNEYEFYDEFNEGQLDYIEIGTNLEKRDEYLTNGSIIIDSRLDDHFGLFTYNLDKSRGTPLQNWDPCPGNPVMDIGLAIRKAISYATDREQMNDECHNGEFYKTHWPIYPTMTMWLNEDITKYEKDLTKAKELMLFAGYDLGVDTDGDGLSDYDELYVILTDRLNNDTDYDGLTDGDEINIHNTDPFDDDTDDDNLDDANEILYGTDPNDHDTDNDLLLDGDEVHYYNTDPLDVDSDDDSYSDYVEIEFGSDPNNPLDYPGSPTLTSPLYGSIVVFAFLSLLALLLSLFYRKKSK